MSGNCWKGLPALVQLIPTERLRRPAALRIAVTVGVWTPALWWVLATHRFQGPVVLYLTETHGVHLGDIPAPVVAGAVTAWLHRRRSDGSP